MPAIFRLLRGNWKLMFCSERDMGVAVGNARILAQDGRAARFER